MHKNKNKNKKIIILFTYTAKETRTWKIFVNGDQMQYVEIQTSRSCYISVQV